VEIDPRPAQHPCYRIRRAADPVPGDRHQAPRTQPYGSE
jgi:hypothetical protein